MVSAVQKWKANDYVKELEDALALECDVQTAKELGVMTEYNAVQKGIAKAKKYARKISDAYDVMNGEHRIAADILCALLIIVLLGLYAATTYFLVLGVMSFLGFVFGTEVNSNVTLIAWLILLAFRICFEIKHFIKEVKN